MHRLLFGLCLLASCKSPSVDRPPTVRQAPQQAAVPNELCCCERNPNELDEPGEPPVRFESRASACPSGTPAMPEGRCVDWSACGFPSGARRTVADRPDLAAQVDVPAGSCCCYTTEFSVRDTKQCSTQHGSCLDADWCVPDPRAGSGPPVTTPGLPWVDRCVEIADHFEPWRKNPLWASEVSPRAQLIADCQSQKWSIQLQDCLLGSNSPLELDNCI